MPWLRRSNSTGNMSPSSLWYEGSLLLLDQKWVVSGTAIGKMVESGNNIPSQ